MKKKNAISVQPTPYNRSEQYSTAPAEKWWRREKKKKRNCKINTFFGFRRLRWEPIYNRGAEITTGGGRRAEKDHRGRIEIDAPKKQTATSSRVPEEIYSL